MCVLPLVLAPNPVFRQKAEHIDEVDDEVRAQIKAMFETLYLENGIGLGANMVGLLKQVIVIDMKDGGHGSPIAMINPQILKKSDELQSFSEASLSFPGISAEVTRPAHVTVAFVNEQGEACSLAASGFFATVIQHEMDYLQGRTFLDHLSRTKRDALMRKYKKSRKNTPNNTG